MNDGMRTAVLAMMLSSVLSGCQTDDSAEVAWSTKEQSTIKQLPTDPVLSVETVALGTKSDPQRRQVAVDLLRQAFDSGDPLLQANAIEALHSAPSELDPMVRAALVSENRGVRFVAAMTIGKLELGHMSHLLQPLLEDPSESVRAAAIFGMIQCGHHIDRSSLGTMIFSPDPEIRGNAALVLGELGQRSAASMIAQAVRAPMPRVGSARLKMVNLQMAEAMVKLGMEDEIHPIRAALYAPAEEGELTALACMMCGRLGDEKVVPDLVRLARRTDEYSRQAEVRMAAVWALARINGGEPIPEVPLGYLTSEHFQLRMQAALTLGELGDHDTVNALGGLLDDPSPLVQVAAAGAILKITRSYRITGTG